MSKEPSLGPISQQGYWPGRVETYFDLYVAGVWNVFRTARLLTLALIVRMSNKHGMIRSFVDLDHTATRTMNDMLASIPYHLTENLQAFLYKQHMNTQIEDPGRHLGGLLLMHPLYVASRLHFVSEDVRAYIRDCLVWIGENMGLGQATLLAKVGSPTSYSCGGD